MGSMPTMSMICFEPGRPIFVKTAVTLEKSEENDLLCNFAGFKISGDKLNGLNVDQNQYLKNLEHLSATATFPDLRSMRMKFGWLGNSRADCAVETSQLKSRMSSSRNATGKLSSASTG